MKIKLIIYSIVASMLFFFYFPVHAMKRLVSRGIPKTHAFVLDTLLHAYPELRGRTILVKDNMHKEGFQVAKYINMQGLEIDKVCVPFTKKELVLAQKFKKEGGQIDSQQAYEKLMARGFIGIAQSLFLSGQNRAFQATWQPKVFSLLEEEGFACRSSTLDLWQGCLLHEGAHILFNDCDHIVSLEDIVEQFKVLKKPSRETTVAFLEHIIPILKLFYLAEYRADQEAIRRTNNAAILRAVSEYHRNNTFWKQLFSVSGKSMSARLDSLFSPHPDDFLRAHYFAQAAHDLEKKWSKTGKN